MQRQGFKVLLRGFTEQKLTGQEIYWAAYQPDLIDGKTVRQCNDVTYRAKVETAYSHVTVAGRSTLHSFVHGHDENWREEMSGDVTSMGQVFAKYQAAVIDLQAFVADDGNMSVFDAQGLSKALDFYVCWANVLVIFGDLIADDE
ncbi:hypothetical protein [Jiella marina]|uniref:hypothetical protein n=1 Tax=Jiella sp. LLJ827 TaxID=2917712 RepID=UPI002100A995|nr:hypothetical protein [Jiella sp. LLJ827]MCQ0987418.1 hypothetical protein [Jiella sp. LLJ827]